MEAIAGYVYLMSDGTGLYKIGYSTEPERRRLRVQYERDKPSLEILWTGFYYDAPLEEKRLHALYDHCREQGEWFALGDQEISDIIDASSDEDDPTVQIAAIGKEFYKPRVVYISDDLWWELRTVLSFRRENVSAWFRKQAKQCVIENSLGIHADAPGCSHLEDSGNGKEG